MTRMAEIDQHEPESYDEEAPRSIFSALWFRALVVVLVLGVVAAVAVPYALDVTTTPTPKPAVALRPAAPPPSSSLPQPAAPVQQVSPPSPSVPVAKPPEPPKPEPPRPETFKPEPPRPAVATAAKPAEGSKAPAAPKSAGPKTPEAPRAVEMPKPSEPPTVASATKPGEAPSVAPAPKSSEPPAAKPSEPPKTAPTPKAAEPPKIAAVPPATSPAPPRPAVARPAASSGPYWVQVGAYKDEATARRVADKLREQNFVVEHSVYTKPGAPGKRGTAPAAPNGGDRYNVFVSGLALPELNAKVAAKGATAQPVAGGVMVTPSMPLREAVALSKDLAAEGLKVQVRRVTAPASGGSSPAASPGTSGETLHRVRVGSFADRAAALAAARELQARGYKVFLARGNQ